MGSCTRRHLLLSICILQLLTTIERQIFDFLGFMWAPIFANFFHIIFVIFGFFGAYTFRLNYLITYALWNILWMAWNIFIICFYLNVGVLNENSDILNLGTGSVSWFEINGYGCKAIYSTNITAEDHFALVRPEKVDGCVLDYTLVEIIHASIQLILLVLGLAAASLMSGFFCDKNLMTRRGEKPKPKRRQSLYSIEFSPPTDAVRSYLDESESSPREVAKPMTPRRVKRRSVMTRGTTNRQSSTSTRSNKNSRSSTRASRRKFQQNPVTKLIDQQGPVNKAFPYHQQRYDNPPLTESNLKYLNTDMTVPSASHLSKSNLNTFQHNIMPDPIYYNMSSSTSLLHQSSAHTKNLSDGLSNPMYQHSSSNISNNPDVMEDPYQRPPSARSSYSNFHGARYLSSYNPSPGSGSENVFSEIGNRSQPIPQVPQRKAPSRESVRSMAFLNNGPPAYNLNYHTPPDSETTM